MITRKIFIVKQQINEYTCYMRAKAFLKKSLLLCIVFISVLLSGCTTKPKSGLISYPWPVYISFIYKLADEAIPANSLDGLDEYMATITRNYKGDFNIAQPDGYLQIDLLFDAWDVTDTDNFNNYKEFLQFFGLPNEEQDTAIVSYRDQTKLFYYEREFVFENPWKTILSNDSAKTRVSEINTAVRNCGFTLDGNPQYFYALNTSFRRTSVTGAYKHENNITEHNYYFYGDDGKRTDTIRIYDRFANQVAWYISALLATGMFMAATYLVLRLLDKQKQIAQ